MPGIIESRLGAFEFTENQVQLNKEVSKALKKLRALPQEFRFEKRKMILAKAAEPVVDAARGFAPKSGRPHKRYSGGRLAATYYPGNLRRAIRILKGRKFDRSDAIFVGPKVNKGATKGEFKGPRVDAYYAHFVEFGTPYQPGVGYMRRAYAATRKTVVRSVSRQSEQVVRKFANKHKIN